MENKIDIAAILKDCPRGMELDCTIYEGVTLDSVVFESEYHYENINTYPIKIVTKSGFSTRLTKYGQNVDIEEAKCVIFPKGKNTWEKFVSPCKFKDGDILATDLGSVFILNTHRNTNECYGCYAGVCCDGVFYINEPFAYKECCNLATKEEREKLFQTIKDNGYKWNAETKTLEKLIEPKFKVGDRVKPTYNTNQYIIKGITDTHYTLVEVKEKFKYTEPIIEDKNWELVPNKFDVKTLKTFDQVLVRLSNSCIWMPKFFYHYDIDDADPKMKYYPFVTTDNVGYPQCVPYKGNEHLCRTTDDCDEFYRVWEK